MTKFGCNCLCDLEVMKWFIKRSRSYPVLPHAEADLGFPEGEGYPSKVQFK